jgi:soluble lytic murein transglycosylase-like protein
VHRPPAAAQVEARPFARQIEQAARDAGLDPVLVHAVIDAESRYNPVARSPKGALGLMQVLPETAARYGVAHALLPIEGNLKAGTRYLRDLMALFENRLDLALAAYNAGENAVLRHGKRIPPYRETLQYVPAVLDRYRAWREPDAAVRAEPSRIEYLPGTLLGSARLPGGAVLP